MKLLITVLFITAVGLPAYDRHSAIKLGLDDWARRNTACKAPAPQASCRPRILTIGHWSFPGNRSARQNAADPRRKNPSSSEESLIDWRVLRADKSSRNGVVAGYETKRIQFDSMSVYFQNGQQKRQHDRGIDKRWRCFSGHMTMVRRYRLAK
jgi:hypothetical protein